MTLRSDKFLDAIRAGHTRFAARFSRRDTVEGTAPDWSDFPTQVVEFYTLLREKGYGTKTSQSPAGAILAFTPYNVHANDGTNYESWAEYSEADYSGNGEFEAEGWRMQLLEVIE